MKQAIAMTWKQISTDRRISVGYAKRKLKDEFIKIGEIKSMHGMPNILVTKGEFNDIITDIKSTWGDRGELKIEGLGSMGYSYDNFEGELSFWLNHLDIELYGNVDVKEIVFHKVVGLRREYE